MSRHSPFLGGLEELIMLAIDALGKSASVANIGHRIAASTGGDPYGGALYVGVHRLLDKGYLTAHWQESVARRGGKSHSNYQLTEAGRKRLARMETIRARIKAPVPITSTSWWDEDEKEEEEEESDEET